MLKLQSIKRWHWMLKTPAVDFGEIEYLAAMFQDQPIIIPGDAAASILIRRVTASDESERMPPIGEPLQPEQIASLRSWISRFSVVFQSWLIVSESAL